ncbi:LOW QUALITY PROTEIN: thioredoxin, mitochondrial [Neolamprologus brichardi]|uniref:LOW QUALITY PROTEIN: thioredoxin, mitochondrial n=1 Tax=Neolamprologus brichardi TaxID=32507 RepID=UPI001643EBB2|nr:LOW QUALITY PROTEIN: thioredoxin, mitochondrial [Neolamprologus brichardi]
MAHRLVLRRLWTLSVNDIRCLPTSTASVASSCYSTSLQSSTTRVSFLSPSRSLPRALPHTSRREVSFNVQDSEDFTERVINSELPVLVDFHAQWCGPCKILGPRLEKAVAKQKGRVAMAKVDIDDHTDLAIEYGVSAVPTVIAMRGGDVVDHFVGSKMMKSWTHLSAKSLDNEIHLSSPSHTPTIVVLMLFSLILARPASPGLPF